MQLQIKKLNQSAILPTRAYSLDSGMDLYACLDEIIILPPAVSYELVNSKTEYKETEEWFIKQIYFSKFETSPARVLIPTGIAIKLPEIDCWPNEPYETYEATIRPRSGLAVKQGISVHLGTIDSTYTGELKVLVYNFSNQEVVITHGMKIAQLVIQKVYLPQLVEVNELTATSRGNNGFGSTGV
jgi:deoxyuridine 5'-triphosphate nucleotidohydrolase